MAVIFLFSAQDADASKSQSGVFVDVLAGFAVDIPGDWLTFLTRKAAHIFLYLVLGVLVYNAVRLHSLPMRRAVGISILIALSYATFDEIHQLYIPGRSGELRDVLIDTTASGVGIAGYVLLDRRRSGKKPDIKV